MIKAAAAVGKKPITIIPAQPASEDWGNTVNYQNPAGDYEQNHNTPKQPRASEDWGMTQANIKFPGDFGSDPEDFSDERRGGERGGYGNPELTMPLIRLPEAERAKYQNLPPTATQAAAEKQTAEKNRGGVPGWFWWAAGLMTTFFFALLLIFGAYILFIKSSGFVMIVKGAPPRSNVLVDGTQWGVTADDGSVRLTNLTANETKRFDILHPTYTCEPQQYKGANGETAEMIARCKPVPVKPGEDCSNIKSGEFDKSERCANHALDNLGDPPPIDDLLKALNLFFINFESGKYDIPPARMAFLKRAAGYIQKLPPSVVIEVGGHTDNQGTDDYNQKLSENRAAAVRDALVNFGVKPETLTTRGYGETQPKATNDNEDGRFQNRRIAYTAVRR